MLTVLKTAIYNALVASGVNALVSGGIYSNVAPPGSDLPYLVYSVVSIHPQDTFKSKIDDYNIQFTAYSDSTSDAEINNIYAALKTAFDDRELTLTGGTQCLMTRENTIFSEDEMPTADGYEVVSRCDVDYSIIIEEG